MMTQSDPSVFGRLPDGRVVEAFELTNRNGLSARVLTRGATLQSLCMPGRDGTLADIVLGHADLDGYLADTAYAGATIGRVANRIANGRFAIDGTVHQAPVNNGPNSLHGGTAGFDSAIWTVLAADPLGVRLGHVSPDGDQGFPGTLTVEASYSLDDDDRLSIELTATADKPTVVNLTHHSYWNLAGEGSARSALDQMLAIPATRYLPVDADLIPTGELRPVAGSPFDFRLPHVIGARIRDATDPQIVHGRGYDHSWVLGDVPDSPERLAAWLHDPVSGRTLELLTNQPAMQLYTANHFDGSRAGKSGRLYRQGDGIALEPQGFPNSPNTPSFPAVRLDPGQVYRNRMVFRFTRRRLNIGTDGTE